MKISLDTTRMKFSGDLVRLIGEIDEFKGAWKVRESSASARFAALRRTAFLESVTASTRIEGSALDERQVAKVLAAPDRPCLSPDEADVIGCAEVMEKILGSWGAMPVTEETVLKLHAILTGHGEADAAHRGRWKTVDNSVAAFDAEGRCLGVVLRTAPADETPALMRELLEWYHRQAEDPMVHPLVAIGMFAAAYLAIHPFADGNGRLARALTTLLLLKSGYGFVAYASLERGMETRRRGYYLSLRRTQTTLGSEEPQWEHWLRFFLDVLRWETQRLEKRIEDGDWLLSDVPQLSFRILMLAREVRSFRMADLVRKTGASRITLGKHLRKLVESGRLARHGVGKGTFYTLTDG
ncbi:Fic family protein [Sutterella sp.]|uniref:Fic family protein n=1 Tax=Sutterella sp. TaxID=1981025 RepID=UPI0026DF9680|nr:Fic family protein [Sutterella sp.]MDO5530828.1 Fic family protein [Sutterella sp.]